MLEVTTGKRHLTAQVAAAANQPGDQPVTTFTGNAIDEIFKRRVKHMLSAGTLPQGLQIAGPGVSPDLWLGRIAWDLTTAEQGRHHIRRDVHPDPSKWDAYFIL